MLGYPAAMVLLALTPLLPTGMRWGTSSACNRVTSDVMGSGPSATAASRTEVSGPEIFPVCALRRGRVVIAGFLSAQMVAVGKARHG